MKQEEAVLSLYFSKENLGITYYSHYQLTIQCSQINALIYRTSQELQTLVFDKKIKSILTNNDRHSYLQNIPQFVKIVRISEKGLSDDAVQSNLNLLRINPLNRSIKNKDTYIKQMIEESQMISSEKQKIKSLGSLLYFLFNQGSYQIRDKIFLEQIDYFTDQLLGHVIMTQKQYEFLEITKQEIHPSFIKGKGRSKQGFSILNLFEAALITQGAKKIMKNIFKNPTNQHDTLAARLSIIEWMQYFCTDEQSFCKIFKSMHPVENIVKKFKESRVEFEDWRKLVKTMESMIILSKIIAQKQRISHTYKIPDLIQRFIRLIDWNQLSSGLTAITATLDLSNFCIKRGVDKRLDELKKTYDNLPHLLTIYAKQQNWGQDFRIIFMAQVGYLIRVPNDVDLGDVQEEWSLQFTNASGRYYSNNLTQMLDEEYGDIYGEITDRQKKIGFDLQAIVCEISGNIINGFWMTSEIECFWGISIVSKGMCKPRMSSEGFIVSDGWHILLAQDAIDNHVFSFHHESGPVDRVYNSEENLVNTNYSNRLMMISGPNASGKTIFMKQTAIIIYLAHIGVFIPAKFAEIPYIDKIVIIDPIKSIYRQQNGFEAEIKSLSRATTVGMITSKSLVLIDELGSSIDSKIAAKIFASAVNFLSNNENSTIKTNLRLKNVTDHFRIPISIFVTHLTEIMSLNLIKQGYFIRYLTMDMEKGRICFYKVKPGLVKKGYGIDCAKQIMAEQFITKAEKYWKQIKQSYLID